MAIGRSLKTNSEGNRGVLFLRMNFLFESSLESFEMFEYK